ncbi:ATP-binding cassette domain-containing protein [Falsiroseomonas sp. CW058]|uniref:ATP-binding cassette domain-containing protein n=1 Tax=Falsiroseomonas sp. CW058 TaxID=3388664 RepID=UPI003D31B9E3
MIIPGTRAAGVAEALRRAPAFSGVLATALGLSVARQALALATPLLTMHVFDSAAESASLDTLAVLTVAFVVALLMSAVMRAVRAALMSAMADDLSRRLSLDALQAAVRSALAGSRKPGLAALQDTAELRRFLGGGTLADLFDMVAVPIVLTVLWMLHPVYAVVTAACCALIGLLGLVLDRTTRGMVRSASDRQLQTMGELQGRLRQADMLEGLGMLAAVVRRWQPAQATALREADHAQARARAVRGLTEFAAYAAQGLTVVVGVVLALGDQASPGSIVAAMMLAGTAVQPMARVVLAWREWAYSALAWRRLQELFVDHAAPEPLPADPDGVEGLWLREVAWTPPGATRPVIGGVSLHCAPGSLTLVVGSNGAGKSTLLRLALGLLKPEAGQVTLDGQDTHHVDREEIGPRIGYLPQDVQLLDGSVLDNIARFGPRAAETAVDAARLAGAHDMIGRLPQGYAAEAGPSGTLSQGQRRMIGLARALHGAPRLLVLDEPEAGLDRPGRDAARAAVLAARGAGAACLVVSHDPALWEGQVDQVLHLEKRGGWSVTVAAPMADG